MTSFPDLTIDQEEPGQITTLQEEATCQTKECQDCKKEMKKRLQQVGLMPATINEVLDAQNATTCTKYRFSRNDKGVYAGKKEHDHSSSSSDEEEERRKKERKQKKHDEKRRRERHRRQALPANQTIIGERFPLSCMSKGMTTDASGTVSLCSSCWVWRRLPDNYSPQYVNELICDTADTSCLSGYATCGVGHRAIEVVRDDNGVKTTVALSAGSYCECRAALNSAIESLVTGAGLPSSLPALTATGAPLVGSG